MKAKRIVLVIVAALVALSAVGFASAQPGAEGEQSGRGFRRHRPIVNGIRNVVDAVKESTGLETDAIVAQLADGKTLAEIIGENGGSVEDVTAGLLAQVSERLVTAVTNGRITQERADEFLANTATRLDELLNRVFERLTQREFPGGRRGQQAPNEI